MMPVDAEMIESIRRVEQDIRESAAKTKRLKADALDAAQQLQEYQDVQELAAKLKEARATLKAAIMDDRIAAELEAETATLKDLREILSHHLVRYREASENSYIEDEESNKVRPILVTAKLGKPEYHQEEMFVEAADAHA
jgi:polyribonucleotide nucleotidyltransferase